MTRTCRLAATALLAASPVLAEADAVPAPRALVVRGGVTAYLVGGLNGPEDGFAFVAFERTVARWLELELSVGHGFANVHDTGTHVGVAARVPLLASDSGRHVLFTGAGSTLALGGAYGSVPFARVELGYELRLGGFNLVAAAGPAVALRTSRTPPALQQGSWSVFSEEGPFHAGDTGPSFQVAAGWAL